MDRSGRRTEFLERQRQRRDHSDPSEGSFESGSYSGSGSYSQEGSQRSYSSRSKYSGEDDASRSHSGSYYSDEDATRSYHSGSHSGAEQSFYEEEGPGEDSFFQSVGGETPSLFDEKSAAVSASTNQAPMQSHSSPQKSGPVTKAARNVSPLKLSPKRGRQTRSPNKKVSPKRPNKSLNLTAQTAACEEEEESLWLEELELGSAMLPPEDDESRSGSYSSRSNSSRSGSYSSRSRSASYSSRSHSGSYSSRSRGASYSSRSRSGSYSDRSHSGSYSNRSPSGSCSGSHYSERSEQADQLDETLNDSGKFTEQQTEDQPLLEDSFVSQNSQPENAVFQDSFVSDASFSEPDHSGFPVHDSFLSDHSHTGSCVGPSHSDRSHSDTRHSSNDDESENQYDDKPIPAVKNSAPQAFFISENSGFPGQDSFVSHDGSTLSNSDGSRSESRRSRSGSYHSNIEGSWNDEVLPKKSDFEQNASFVATGTSRCLDQPQESFLFHEGSNHHSYSDPSHSGSRSDRSLSVGSRSEGGRLRDSFAGEDGFQDRAQDSFLTDGGSQRSASHSAESRSNRSRSGSSRSRGEDSFSRNGSGSFGEEKDFAPDASFVSIDSAGFSAQKQHNTSLSYDGSDHSHSNEARSFHSDSGRSHSRSSYSSGADRHKENKQETDGSRSYRSSQNSYSSESDRSRSNYSENDSYPDEPNADSTNAFDSFAIDSGHKILSLEDKSDDRGREESYHSDGRSGQISISNSSGSDSVASFSDDSNVKSSRSAELSDGSLHTSPPPGCDDSGEDVSVLSLLPPNACAVAETEDSYQDDSASSYRPESASEHSCASSDSRRQEVLEDVSDGQDRSENDNHSSGTTKSGSSDENTDRESLSAYSDSVSLQKGILEDEPSITSFVEGDPFLGGSGLVPGVESVKSQMGTESRKAESNEAGGSQRPSEPSDSNSFSSGSVSLQENSLGDEPSEASFSEGDPSLSESDQISHGSRAGSEEEQELLIGKSGTIPSRYGGDNSDDRNDESCSSEPSSRSESDSEPSVDCEYGSLADPNTMAEKQGNGRGNRQLQDPPEKFSEHAKSKAESDGSNSGSDDDESRTDFSSNSDKSGDSGDLSGSLVSDDNDLSLLSELQSIAGTVVGNEPTLKLPEPNTYGGYSREQMTKVSAKYRRTSREDGSLSLGGPNGKSEALLAFVANVSDAISDLEKIEEVEKKSNTEGKTQPEQTVLTSTRLLHAFEALAGILLQLSDELELLLTFSKGKESPAIDALESLLDYSQTIDDTFMILKPILLHYVTAEIDEELDDFLYGMNLLLDLLCELSHRVGEKQYWNARANTSYASMLELLARDTLEVSCIYEDMDTPAYEISYIIQDAWEATGHIEEIKTLLVTSDLFMFRQICYEVILSTDQWCPDNNILMDICGVDDSSDDQLEPHEDDTLSPPPEAALQILEKIHGDPLYRTSTLASVLRRILPPRAITDAVISENYARIRNTVRNPLGMPPSTLVSITSIPESFEDPDSLGVAGVGKSTLAAMTANHEDVRRFFNDGVAWIYVGETELTYNRYVQCLQDLLAQLEIDEDEEPLFPELLHCPGESLSMRRRREEGFMIYLRETIVEFLRYKNVLIVLDDVCFEPDLDWFDFSPAPLPDDEDNEENEGVCAVLVTSRRRNLLPPSDTVEVDMLDEEEGVELLIKESGELSRALVSDAPETTSVIRECACHPLAIKSVGRWLNLKHATAASGNSMEDIHDDFVRSMDKILKSGLQEDADMMYEILNMSLSPAINGEPTRIIKLCFAAFVKVFCERKHISDFALADTTPIVPLTTTELLFEALLGLEEETLKKEGSLFYAQKNEAAKLIPEALSALGVFKVIITYAESQEGGSEEEEEDEKYFQIMHRIQQEYGEYLYEEDETLSELAKNGELRWNAAFSKAFTDQEVEWDTESPDAGLDYALEMLPSHMIRGDTLIEAGKLLCNDKFVRGRLFALGRENGTRRHIKDCEILFKLMSEQRAARKKKYDPKGVVRAAYSSLGTLLRMDEEEYIEEEGSPEAVEVGRCHFEIGYSLAGMRCWEGAIAHWEEAQEFLVSALGMVELVAGILYNVGVVYCEMHEYDQALVSLKQCLRIRGAIHGEEHILYAHTIQKVGDVFLAMSDYHEAMESYNWALDVMHIEPSHHRIAIGDVLEHIGKIHYSKGEIEDALISFQDALRSKQIDLGEDHPELSSIFHQIGNCLSNQGKTDEAVAHLEEAIRLKKLDPDGGPERDSDVLTIEGILSNLNGMQQNGLKCYERALHILVTKVPHKKEKVASLLHLIGCVYLMSGEHKKAMKLFEESLHARRKVLGFVHLDVASTLFNMAFLHQTKNRLDKALKCLEEALKIRQLRLPDSEKVAVTHEKIGNLARGIGKTKKAENAFQEALRILKLIHGKNHEAVATVLQALGDLMDDLGEYEDAMKHYVEALEIRESRLGPDDLAVAETYYSMGFTLQNTGALDRALQCLEESLSIRKFQLGDDAKDVGDTLNMMGYLQAKRGELDDALSLLWDALRIRKLQDDHIKVSETLNNIGNVHREKQEFDLAIECYEECLRIRRAELGDESEKVADALISCGNVQSDMGDNEEAMESYKEALGIRNMLFGEQDESVATVLQYMGTLDFRANELDRAFQLLDEFIRIRQENGTEPDGDYVNVLFMIGNIHKMQANEEEAKKCWKEAYGVFRKLGLAATNPQIALVMSNLVKDEEVDEVTDENKSKSVLNRITAKVKSAARTANEAGNAVKRVSGMKGQDRGSQLL